MSRRRTALLAGSAIVATLGLVAPTTAHAKATCTGTGSAKLSVGIAYYPTVTANVGFTVTFNCTEGGTITARGTLDTASCGRSSGSGTIDGVGSITVETAGSMLIVTGAANGGGNATPIPNTSTVPFGNSCSNGTASDFALVGGVNF